MHTLGALSSCHSISKHLVLSSLCSQRSKVEHTLTEAFTERVIDETSLARAALFRSPRQIGLPLREDAVCRMGTGIGRQATWTAMNLRPSN